MRYGRKSKKYNKCCYLNIDVVPVNPDTVDEWTHPPYSGYYDGMSLILVLSIYALYALNIELRFLQVNSSGVAAVATTRVA